MRDATTSTKSCRASGAFGFRGLSEPCEAFGLRPARERGLFFFAATAHQEPDRNAAAAVAGQRKACDAPCSLGERAHHRDALLEGRARGQVVARLIPQARNQDRPSPSRVGPPRCRVLHLAIVARGTRRTTAGARSARTAAARSKPATAHGAAPPRSTRGRRHLGSSPNGQRRRPCRRGPHARSLAP